MKQHPVIDFMHCISDRNEAQSSRMASLKSHTHPDMVHLTARGYEKLAIVQQTRGPAAGGDS